LQRQTTATFFKLVIAEEDSMRGLGEFQRAQMKRTDPRVGELFDHLRRAIDVLEQIMMHPYSRPAPDPPAEPKPDNSPAVPTSPRDPGKLAHTIKEVRELVGVSHTKLYHAIQNKELRAVKCGRRTLILAKDLQAWIDAWPPTTRKILG
jgi:excisionase family DNA binding protein